MAKEKVNAVVASESLSAAEEKQMSDMRDQDNVREPEQDIQAQPEAKTADVDLSQADGKPADAQNKTVPHEALEAERQKRKAAEKRAQELEVQQARADERMKLINEAIEARNKPQQTTPTEIPDPEKDALGNLKYLNKVTSEELAVLKKFKEDSEARERHVNQSREITTRAAEMERQYIAQNPDYNEASAYLINSRLNELQALGLNEMAARQQIQQETYAMAQHGLQTGVNPAEMVYKIAGLRGYKKASAAQASSEADKIATIAAGQRANQSLTDISGNSSSKTGVVSAKDLANMSEAQFAKVMKNLDEDGMRAAFGA